MKKKHIAFVVNGLYGGGAERILQVVLNNIDRQRYDITLINHREEKIVSELYPSDIRYKNILRNAKTKNSGAGRFWCKIYNKINLTIYDNFSPRIFRRLYLRDKFDVEIAFIEGYATRIVSGGNSCKKIAWVHIDLKLNPWTNIAFRSQKEQARCYSAFDKVISVSQSVKKSVEELFSCKSIVIYNPIDADKIRRMSSQVAVKRGKRPLLFVSAGRLVPQKGYDRLIPIAGKLTAEGFKFRLWIIGKGTEKEYLERQISKWELENIVTLLGYQSNPYPYIAAGDVFVCSSRSEGYSTVVTEALILGLPVITTLCAGMKELLDDNKYGIIVENEDLALLDGMRKILKNKNMVKKTGNSDRFSLRHQISEIYKVIDN